MTGCYRLLCSILAVGVKSPQDKAAQILLILGFCVEFFVVYSVLVEQAKNDFRLGSALLWLPKIGVFILLTFVFFHQIQIFRNFSLLSNLDSVTKVANIKRYVELSIYILFGVLTGEAGYMLTIISLPNLDGIIYSFFLNLFGGDAKDLGLILKCLFICVAALVCLLVILWDILFYSQSKNANRDERSVFNSEKFKNFKKFKKFKKFVYLDVLSFLYWLAFAFVLIPNLREYLGVITQGADNDVNRNGVIVVWMLMFVFALSYCFICTMRITEGIIQLAKAKSYEKSLEEII